MQHVLLNTSSEVLIYNTIGANSSIVLYDDETLEISPEIDNIISGLENGVSEIDSIAYQLYVGNIVYLVDGIRKDKDAFFAWFDSFLSKYNYYLQFKSAGFISVKLDVNNDTIVIGNRNLIISDIPDGIPVSKIGEGDITNLEFSTLQGINTSISIQNQLDSKANTSHNHTYTYILSTPSSLWTLNHGLGVRPQVELFDSQYNLVLATVEHPDVNTVKIKFSQNYTCIANLTI